MEGKYSYNTYFESDYKMRTYGLKEIFMVKYLEEELFVGWQ